LQQHEKIEKKKLISMQCFFKDFFKKSEGCFIAASGFFGVL
jgi:hypothetical protein